MALVVCLLALGSIWQLCARFAAITLLIHLSAASLLVQAAASIGCAALITQQVALASGDENEEVRVLLVEFPSLSLVSCLLLPSQTKPSKARTVDPTGWAATHNQLDKMKIFSGRANPEASALVCVACRADPRRLQLAQEIATKLGVPLGAQCCILHRAQLLCR